MITRIEIDGFKTFREFSVDFRPFQVFVGPNGSGKSNLFDAIALLANLAGDDTLQCAFRRCRGGLGECFSMLPDGSSVDKMRFAVEMLIAPQITDTFGLSAEVSATRLRYELALERRSELGFERLAIVRENLIPLAEKLDPWFRPNVPARRRKAWIVRKRREPFISTAEDGGYIYLHQDRRSGGWHETPLMNRDRTVLSGVNSAEYPTAYAARCEIANWRRLNLVPAMLRESSHCDQYQTLLEDGSNLAAMLFRMSLNSQSGLTGISSDLAAVMPGLREVNVENLVESEGFAIRATLDGGATFSSRVLPDGVLRALALVALSHDPLHKGVVCLEEPENGVYPAHLPEIVKVLKRLATDFDSDPTGGCRQVLINSHSPTLPAYVDARNLQFVQVAADNPLKTCVNRVVRQIPLFPSDDADQATPDRDYTIHEILQQLAPVSVREQDGAVEEKA